VNAALRYLAWFVRIGVFIVLFILAARNTEPVGVRFLFGDAWHAPLALVLFLSLALGVSLGLLACLPRLLRQRRQIAKLRKALEAAAHQPPGRAAPATMAPTLPIDAPTIF